MGFFDDALTVTSACPEDLGAYADWWRNVSPSVHVALDDALQAESRVIAGCDMMLAPWPVAADGLGAIEAWDANAAAVGEIRDALVAADRFGGSELVTVPSFALSGVTFVMSYENMTIGDWRALAFERAGIDPLRWKPELGVDFNRAILPMVYEYYAELYRQNPHFKWAGLAAVVGPGFLGAFEDLGDGSDLAGAISVFAFLTGKPLPGGVSYLIGEEVEWYETEFLTMQKRIFMDLAPAHEAYRLGGIAAIEQLARAGQIDSVTLEGFRQLDTGERLGSARMIDRSASTLVAREQLGVIQDNYDRMLSRPLGDLVTGVFTFAGRPSVPGGRSFGEVYPLEVTATLPVPLVPLVPFGPRVEVMPKFETPLPDGNIADPIDRMNYIRTEILPTFNAMSHQEVLDTIAVDPETRAHDYRMANSIDDLAGRLDDFSLNGVDVGFDIGWPF